MPSPCVIVAAITLWLAVFIAVGTPSGSINSDPLWLMVYAAVIALGGAFFALHARANASGVVAAGQCAINTRLQAFVLSLLANSRCSGGFRSVAKDVCTRVVVVVVAVVVVVVAIVVSCCCCYCLFCGSLA